MQNNEQNFLKSIEHKCVKGERNNNIPYIVKQAKFYELDEFTAISNLKTLWADFSKVDENSFKKAWENPETTPEKTVSEYKKSAKERAKEIHNKDNNLNQDQAALNLELLKKHLENVEIPEADLELTETTKDLEYWFDKNDTIWISSRWDDIRGFQDAFTLFKYPRSLNEFSYMCVNPLNSDAMERTDNNVSEFKYLLLESDNLDLETQARLFQDMINFNVPIKSVVYSGGKSFHTLIQLKDIYTVEDYKEYAKKLFDLINSYIGISVDTACKNPSRLTRSPFGTYDKIGENKGNRQELFYLNPSNEVKEDAYTKIKSYFKQHIGLISATKEQDDKNKINPDELLYYVDRNIVYDIWSESSKFYWKIKDFSGRSEYIMESFPSRTRLNECVIQFIDKKYKSVFNDVKDLNDFSVKYKQLVFIPCLKKDLYVNDKIVNTFKPGFLSEIINDNNIPSELNNSLEKYLNNLFGENIKEKNWVLQWMRNYMHNFKKMLTAPVFWDKPGIGKSMLAEAFGAAVGNWASPKQNQIEDNRFNAWIKNAVIILDEVSCGSKKDGKAFGDYLKGLITQEVQTIEYKGRDLSETIISNCYIFTANCNNYIPPVFIEEYDRRYTIIRNDESKNLDKIWTADDFDKWNSGEYKKILMKYIYNLPEDKSVNLNHGLETKYKLEVLDMSKNKCEKAVEAIYNEFKNLEFVTNDQIKAFMKEEYDSDVKFDSVSKILVSQYGWEKKQKKINAYPHRGFLTEGK